MRLVNIPFETRSVVRGAVAAVLVGLGLAGAAQTADAQRSVRDEARQAMATRTELQEAAASAEQVAASRAVGEAVRRQKAAEAKAIRERLTTGDFVAGDRISIKIIGDREYADTLTVRPGQVLQIPNMGRISLQAVLRSELDERLRTEVGKFLRNATISAGSVTRLAVLGAVGRPGFHQLPAEAMLSTVIMTAGGPVGISDLRNVTIRRGDELLWDARSVQVALQEGVTLQELGVRSGDELIVGEVRRGFSWTSIFPVISSVIQVVSAAIFLANR
jgi:hypothetical protein